MIDRTALGLRLPPAFRWWGLGAVLSFLAACGGASSQADRPPPAPNQTRVVTFNTDVAPILFAHCATCHRPIDDRPVPPGGDPLCVAGAPFSLLDYASAQPRAGLIADATRARVMPPWLPEPGHGEFVNERRLTAEQIGVIQQWVAQGAPEGDPADRPPAPAFPQGWQLGTPDLVVQAEETYTLQPGTSEVFRSFVLPVPRAAARYVRGVEFRADNVSVVHHANLAIDPLRVSRRLDREDEGPGFAAMPENDVQNVFGWSPGKVPILEPADTAWRLDEGSDLVVQLHMVPGARPEPVRPSVGLFLTDRPPTRVPIVVKLESKAIEIAAGASGHVVEDAYTLPVPVSVVSVYPHAHYLAREIRGEASLPDGTVMPLVWIRRWDVRWQDQYRLRTPLPLPQGTTLRMRISYDNSAANPHSPRPPRVVRWGPNSTDEMGALWVEVVPQSAADADVLTRDYFRRAQLADIAGAELAARSTPSDAGALNALALRYAQAGRLAEAQAQLEQAVRLQPGDAEAQSNLGTVLQMQGRIGDALPRLATAARLKPDDDRIRVNLANGLQAAGRLDEAMREYRRAVALDPENADAHFNLAMLLGPQNRLAEAVTHLQRVIEISPWNAEAYRNLSIAYSLQGRLDAAVEQAQHAVRLAPQSAAARQQLDQLLAVRGR